MRSLVLLVVAAGCGDNLIVPIDAPDAPVEADADIDAAVDADPCPDTVRVVQSGNPGNSAANYPADGWWSDDTRANGTVAVDATLAPPPGFGCRSVRLTTGATTGSPAIDKAQLISFAKSGVALSTINTINYWAYRSSVSTGGPAIDLAINVSVTGSTVPSGIATLVYEPYQQSGGNAGIVVDTWQHWDATATTIGDGLWWTSKIANPAPGSQANPQPWVTFQTLWSDAKVHGYGFNVGSYNPNMVIAGDGLVFGTTSTDF